MGYITKAMKRERARVKAAKKLPAEVAIGAALMLGGRLATVTPKDARSTWGGNRYRYFMTDPNGYRLFTKPYRKQEYAARAFVRLYQKEFPNGRPST